MFLCLDKLCKRLETNVTTGLTKIQARALLQRTGPNVLTPPTRTNECVKFIKNLFYGKKQFFFVILIVDRKLMYSFHLL